MGENLGNIDGEGQLLIRSRSVMANRVYFCLARRTSTE